MTQRIIVVGASLAGLRAARMLREQGFEGRITLIGAERHPPYDRPPLSKQILSGAWDSQRGSLAQPPDDNLELQLATAATQLDPAKREVVLDTGERMRFDALVLATGASPRTLAKPVPAGVHTLRTIDDCLTIRQELTRGGPLAVVGAGFIGAEVAAVARNMGIDVTIVEALPAPLNRALGSEVGSLCAQLHRDHGVTVRCNVSVDGFDGSHRVQRVRLNDGTSVEADTVLVGIGVTPNTGWLESSGLSIHDGVVCDAYCCVDQTAQIYAAGDVARWFHPHFGRHMRVEHWTNAVEQATLVARNIVYPHHQQPYSPVPYFWSDQYDAKLQLVGQVQYNSRVEVLPSPTGEHTFIATYSNGDKLSAAVAYNWPRAIATCRRVLAQGGTAGEARERVRQLG